MYKATGEFISNEDFAEYSAPSTSVLVFPPESKADIAARKMRNANQLSSQIQTSAAAKNTSTSKNTTSLKPIVTLTDNIANIVTIYDDEPSMTRVVKRIHNTPTHSSMTSYGLFTGKSIYIPGGAGRLDFEMSIQNEKNTTVKIPVINSITFHKGPQFPGTNTPIKFLPQ